MNHKIFISYRRSDSAGTTGRLHDYLSDALGSENVFKDVQDIPAGVKFTQVLKDELEKCSIILVMIGKEYVSVKDSGGNLRLHNPNDFVHIEVATALSSNKIVIPVLVNGAGMPAADKLPPKLKDLVEYNAVVLSHDRWKSDFEVLLKKLEHHIGPKKKANEVGSKDVKEKTGNSSSKKWLLPAVFGLLLVVAGIFILPDMLNDGDYEGDNITTPAAENNYRDLLIGVWACYQYGDEYNAGANLHIDIYHETGNVSLGRNNNEFDFVVEQDIIRWYDGDRIDRTIEILSLNDSEMLLQFADDNGDAIQAKYRIMDETF